MNLNRAIIVGRVTQDPELRTTPSGHPVCTFSVATNRVWSDSETKEKQEKTEFHNVVAWRRLAEIANQYLQKGALVMVEGRIETRNWDDQNGNKRYRTEIIADNMQLGPRPVGGREGTQRDSATNEARPKSQQRTSDDEIPTIDADDTPGRGNNDEDDTKEIPF